MFSIDFQVYINQALYEDMFECSYTDSQVLASSQMSPVLQGGDAGFIRTQLNRLVGKIYEMTQVSEDQKTKAVDMVLNTLETIPLVLQDLSNCSTVAQVIGAFIRAYKMFTQSCIASSCADSFTWIADKVKEVMSMAQRAIPTGPVLQAGELQWVLDGAKSILSNFKKVRESAGVKRILELLKYFLTFGLFTSLGLTWDKLNYEKWDRREAEQKHNSIVDFVYYMLESLVWFIERSMQAVKTKSFSPFLHSKSTYSEWAEKAGLVLEDSLKVNVAGTLSCPKAHLHSEEEKKECVQCTRFGNLDHHSFIKRLTTCLEEGETILKFADEESGKRLVKGMMCELRLVEARFLPIYRYPIGASIMTISLVAYSGNWLHN